MVSARGGAVLIIVDGCNVLRSGRDSGPVNDRKKEEFIDQLSVYSRIKKHRIIVVFDGGFATRPEYSVSRGVTVWQAGREYSADDVVKRLLDEAGHPDQTLVVSSDRELNDYAEHRSIVSIDAIVFKKCMYAALKKRSLGRGKQTASGLTVFGEHTQELDALMVAGSRKVFDKDRYFASQDDSQSGLPVNRDRRKKASAEGKVERKLMQILEKL